MSKKPMVQPMWLRPETPLRTRTRRRISLPNTHLHLIKYKKTRSTKSLNTLNDPRLPKTVRLSVGTRTTRKPRRLESVSRSSSPERKKTLRVMFNEEQAKAALEEMKKPIKGKRFPAYLRTSIEAAAFLEKNLGSVASKSNIDKFTQTIEGVYAQYQKWKKDNGL